MATLANGLRKTAALIFTPIFYGLNKFFKSLVNVDQDYKTARSLTRLLLIAGATSSGVLLGAALGSAFPVVGTVLGGVLGGLCASSLGALIAKQTLRTFSWLSSFLERQTVYPLVNNPTNQEKYGLKLDTTRTLSEIYAPHGQVVQHTAFLTVVAQTEAIKTQKKQLGFWSHFFGTPERYQKNQYNKLLTALKYNPVHAINRQYFQVGRETFYWDHGASIWQTTRPRPPAPIAPPSAHVMPHFPGRGRRLENS